MGCISPFSNQPHCVLWGLVAAKIRLYPSENLTSLFSKSDG